MSNNASNIYFKLKNSEVMYTFDDQVEGLTVHFNQLELSKKNLNYSAVYKAIYNNINIYKAYFI